MFCTVLCRFLPFFNRFVPFLTFCTVFNVLYRSEPFCTVLNCSSQFCNVL